MTAAESSVEPRDLATTFLHLNDTGQVTPLPVGPDFWADMPPILATGRMVSLLQHDADWPSWERHPFGDEVIICVTGQLRLRLELPDGEAVMTLGAGQSVIIPVNIWHTADIGEPTLVIYITEGRDTEVRSRSEVVPGTA